MNESTASAENQGYIEIDEEEHGEHEEKLSNDNSNMKRNRSTDRLPGEQEGKYCTNENRYM